MADSLIGKILGDYRLEERLGKGGMGYVYRGVHKEGVMDDAAIKVLKDDYATDENAHQQFRGEAKKAQAINHANVIRILGFGLHSETEQYYLIMELAKERSLEWLFENRHNAKLEQSLVQDVDLIRQAAEGLAAAHRKEIVHRDLKPANILLQWEEGKYIAKIADFGIAALSDNRVGSLSDGVWGTPRYMSPEQCNAQQSGKQSDIYSLGVILYEAVTGRLPFEEDYCRQHRQASPPSPRNFNEDIPKNLEQIILRCLEKRQEDRFPSASELAEALRHVCEQLRGNETAPPPIRIADWNEADVPTPAHPPVLPASIPAQLGQYTPRDNADPQLIVTDKPPVVEQDDQQQHSNLISKRETVSPLWIVSLIVAAAIIVIYLTVRRGGITANDRTAAEETILNLYDKGEYGTSEQWQNVKNVATSQRDKSRECLAKAQEEFVISNYETVINLPCLSQTYYSEPRIKAMMHYTLGRAYINRNNKNDPPQDDKDAAEEHYKIAIDADPKWRYPHRSLGGIYYLNNKPCAAVEEHKMGDNLDHRIAKEAINKCNEQQESNGANTQTVKPILQPGIHEAIRAAVGRRAGSKKKPPYANKSK